GSWHIFCCLVSKPFYAQVSGCFERRHPMKAAEQVTSAVRALVSPRHGTDGMSSRTLHLARGLGWFSLGLGLTEVALPRQLGRLAGLPDGRRLPLLGLREIVSGLGILGSRSKGPWLWSRVAGDVIDLAFLGNAMKAGRCNRSRLAAATAAVGTV